LDAAGAWLDAAELLPPLLEGPQAARVSASATPVTTVNVRRMVRMVTWFLRVIRFEERRWALA
jgi:hypothetical protein